MNALTLHYPSGEPDIRRWIVAAAIVAAAHLCLIVAVLYSHNDTNTFGASVPAITVDLSLTSASPEIQNLDLAPGPTMEEAEAPMPVPQQQNVIEEPIAPTPPQENPLVIVQEQKPKPESSTERTRPAREKPKNPAETPAPRTSAIPHADRIATTKQAQAGTSAAAAALSSYRQSLAAHLQRFKQYPGSARAAGEQGTPAVAFSVTRDGQATSLRLVRSSGHTSLDAEAVAAVRRAQPLPAPPPEIPASSLTFSVPFNFTMR